MFVGVPRVNKHGQMTLSKALIANMGGWQNG